MINPNDEGPEPVVTITKREYDRLVKNDDWLSCLEAAGVDNWQGFDEAISIRDESKNK